VVCEKQDKQRGSITAILPSSWSGTNHLVLALKTYFDGSESYAFAPRCHCLTLACLATTEVVWPQLESAWIKTCQERGNLNHFHMSEAMALEGVFSDLLPEKRDFLVDGLTDVLGSFRNNSWLWSFTCTVDLEAHKRIARIKSLPSPARLCARIVYPAMLDWYAHISKRNLESVDLIFDRNEPFMRHLRADWENKKFRKKHPAWEIVRSMVTAKMESTPGLQMTDMIAWAKNRLESGSSLENDKFFGISLRAAKITNGLAGVVGEDWLLKNDLPEEGYETINKQRKNRKSRP